MSEEIKINIPFFNGSEEAEIENKLLFHLDEFTNEIMRTITKDKDIMILKKVIEQQQKEIERLNFENHMVKKWNEQLDKNCISKDKIRDMLNYLDNTSLNNYEIVMAFRKMMKELLEENDGDHIPRID